VVRDANTRILELIKGKVDLSTMAIKPDQLIALEKYSDRLNIQKQAGLGYTYLAMNLRKPPLSDLLVREAISKAINFQEIIDIKFNGFASLATGMLPNGHWAKNSDLFPIKYAPKEAQRLLKKSGFKLPIKLTIMTTPDRFRQSLSLIYKDQLEKIGIILEVRILEWATLYQNMREGNFDLFSAQWLPVVDPNLFDWVFHSKNIPEPDKAGGNRGGFYDPDIDKWIEEAQVNFNTNIRKKLYQKIEKKLLRELPYIPLWFEDNIAVSSKRLVGFKPDRINSFLPIVKAHIENEIPLNPSLEKGEI